MPLNPGIKLGPYEIQSPLGAGGMGEVYRARDTRLGRDVAVKILPKEMSADAARKQRFEREAKAISSLNHPNICTLHDVGSQDGVDYLVMECVEGETLTKRLEKGPLPLEQVLRYGAQIADALDKAHRAGIVHRDLKPGNIMLTASGAKLLDFGLAKPTALVSGMTLTAAVPTTPMTQEGTVAGTFQYMSPEQVEGKELDGRSDIFSLGAVLYEMLTGRKAFEGKSQLSVASAILEKEPAPISSIKPLTPPALDHAIRRSLAKDREERWQMARDLNWELAWIGESNPSQATPQTLSGEQKKRERWAWIAAAVFIVAAAASFFLSWSPPLTEERSYEFKIEPPRGSDFLLESGGGNAISPDGRAIVFVAASSGGSKLWVQQLDAAGAHELPGTDNGQYPFWSPDSKSIGFFANGKLERLDIAGGPPVSLAPAPGPRGGTWSAQGIIVFVPTASTGLWKIAASGGPPVPLTTVDSARNEFSHRWPQSLPDGNRFIYLSRGESVATSSSIYLSSLERPQERTLLVKETPAAAAYSSAHGKRPEYLYWLRQQALLAQPFDSKQARLLGDGVTVPGAEVVAVTVATAHSSVSVSNEGTILFGTGSGRYQLVWLNRHGKVLGTVGQPDRYGSLRIAPDGARLVAGLADSSSRTDLWLLELSHAIPSRLTFLGMFGTGAWSPDGQRVGYHLLSSRKLMVRNANGTGQEEIALQSQYTVYMNDWSPDGRYLVYTQQNPEGRYELWLLPLTGERQPQPFLKTGFNDFQGDVSPNSKWIAYTSDESGGFNEVYVTSFPTVGTRWRVSSSGGSFPRWSRDGKELFYRGLDGTLMVVSVRTTPQGLEFGTPGALFRVPEPIGVFAYPYDVAPDGKRILALMPSKGSGDSPSLTVLVNWDAKPKP